MARQVRTRRAARASALPSSEAVTLLWQEWRYRHELVWRSLYRWGAAVVVASVPPYLMPALIGQLGLAVLVFPLLASTLSLFAAWHLAAENARLSRVSQKYRELLGPHAPGGVESPSRILERILSLPIGWVVPAAFLVTAFPLSILNGLILLLLSTV